MFRGCSGIFLFLVVAVCVVVFALAFNDTLVYNKNVAAELQKASIVDVSSEKAMLLRREGKVLGLLRQTEDGGWEFLEAKRIGFRKGKNP